MATTSNFAKEGRPYNLDDAEFMQRSRSIRQHFLNHLAELQAFDPDLNATFATEWLAQIELCEAHPTDETLRDEGQGYTATAEEKRSACFHLAEDLRYFVRKAFVGSKRHLHEFGFSTTGYKSARKNSLGTVLWMLVMKRVADTYLSELTTAEMPATLPPAIHTAGTDLLSALLNSEAAQRERLRQTRLRLQHFTLLHTYYMRCHKAATTLFRRDESMKEIWAV